VGDNGPHAQLVLVGQQGDALMLQQIDARRPARALRHMGQQARVLDLDMPCNACAPALQARERRAEVPSHHIQQMRLQLRVQPFMLLFEIRG